MSVFSVPDFDALRVAVVGDLVADHYLYAEPRRLSREAPVMVLRYRSESIGAGGAANVARNLRALGASVSVFGVVGNDSNGRELSRKLEADGLELSGVERVTEWTTPTKTRILAAEARRFPQQVLRIDREPAETVSGAIREGVARAILERASEFDAIILSDYEYGLVDEEIAAVASALAREGKVAVLDPRREVERFGGLTALTPNIGELARFSGIETDRFDSIEVLREAANWLLARVGCRWLLVTRGNLGMALFGEGLPSEGVAVEASGEGEVTDVTGAGDSAASVFALALAAGSSPTEAMRLANTASGVVVMENGAAVCTRGELEAALLTSPPAVRLSRSSFR
jgi:D-glycero-beta-D-manno-heptose-7-phosphate kinase